MSNRKTSTGHSAGIHSAHSFGEEERKLKRERQRELEDFNIQNGNQNEETVYRDKKGRKLDMLTEFMRQQDSKEGNAKLIKEAQYEWGKGSVQKQEALEKAEEFNEISSGPFARLINDPKLEKMRKEELRSGDPMAEYFIKKQVKSNKGTSDNSSSDNKSKPIYNGPNPTPNRFNIRPGYRWDAIDRSNGFEKKVLIKLNEKSAFKEDEYKWSVSDL